MMIASSLLVILTNVLVLGLLFLIWHYFRGRGPMTAAKLRRTVVWERIEPKNAIPCSGDFGVMAAILRALEQGGSAGDLVRGCLVCWAQTGAVAIGQASKKKLSSFGEDVQAELSFPEELPQIHGAAGLLYQRIYSWLPEDGTIQRSELYQAARQDAEALYNILRQLTQEGQRSLRDMGGSMIENKKVKMGFAEEAREIYTAKGIRLARETVAYAKFVRENPVTGDAVAAVAGGMRSNSDICVLADAIYNGMRAGKQVCR